MRMKKKTCPDIYVMFTNSKLSLLLCYSDVNWINYKITEKEHCDNYEFWMVSSVADSTAVDSEKISQNLTVKWD